MATQWVNLGGDTAVVEFEGELSRTQEKQLFKRAERNALLAQSDSMVLPDRGLSDSKVAKWKTYRQELRDLDFSDPSKITWPTKPE